MLLPQPQACHRSKGEAPTKPTPRTAAGARRDSGPTTHRGWSTPLLKAALPSSVPAFSGWDRLSPVTSLTDLPTRLHGQPANTGGEDRQRGSLTGSGGLRRTTPTLKPLREVATQLPRSRAVQELPSFLQFGEGGTQAARRQQELGVSKQEGEKGFFPRSIKIYEAKKNPDVSQLWLTGFFSGFTFQEQKLLSELCTRKVEEGNSFELAACTSATADTEERLGLGRRACSKSLQPQDHEYKGRLLQNAAAQKLDPECSATSLAA